MKTVFELRQIAKTSRLIADAARARRAIEEAARREEDKRIQEKQWLKDIEEEWTSLQEKVEQAAENGYFELTYHLALQNEKGKFCQDNLYRVLTQRGFVVVLGSDFIPVYGPGLYGADDPGSAARYIHNIHISWR